MGTLDRGVRRLTWPETLRTDSGLSWPVPNVWRQRRAKRVRCTPGLGSAEESEDDHGDERECTKAERYEKQEEDDAGSGARCGRWPGVAD